MFVDERQAQILEDLNCKGRVLVKELSEKFKVSEDLIRKDLNALEKQGKLKKKYGGAVLIKENVQRKQASQRKNVNLESKKAIARFALQQIRDLDIIFLDISTTSIEIARLLVTTKLNITVVTNMLEVVNVLSFSQLNVIFIGGEFDYGRDGFVGSLTNEIISRFRFDKAFMGAVGIDVTENVVTTYLASDGQTKKIVLMNTKESYIIAESEKFNQVGNYQYARVTDFDTIITEKPLGEALVESLDEYEVKLICE